MPKTKRYKKWTIHNGGTKILIKILRRGDKIIAIGANLSPMDHHVVMAMTRPILPKATAIIFIMATMFTSTDDAIWNITKKTC